MATIDKLVMSLKRRREIGDADDLERWRRDVKRLLDMTEGTLLPAVREGLVLVQRFPLTLTTVDGMAYDTEMLHIFVGSEKAELRPKSDLKGGMGMHGTANLSGPCKDVEFIRICGTTESQWQVYNGRGVVHLSDELLIESLADALGITIQ